MSPQLATSATIDALLESLDLAASSDQALLAATVSFALLGNALICGVISGPHDRYGARMAWIATLTVLLAAARYLGNDDEAYEPLLAP